MQSQCCKLGLERVQKQQGNHPGEEGVHIGCQGGGQVGGGGGFGNEERP